MLGRNKTKEYKQIDLCIHRIHQSKPYFRMEDMCVQYVLFCFEKVENYKKKKKKKMFAYIKIC